VPIYYSLELGTFKKTVTTSPVLKLNSFFYSFSINTMVLPRLLSVRTKSDTFLSWSLHGCG